jgi:alcohol dehydrogenase class IV
MDALTHNVESLLSPVYHPICDGIAVEGTRIAARALLQAVREPRDLQARSDMMMASMMGAIAFQKDLGATHSCAHALGTVADMHHGFANAVMIDHVMRFNRDAALPKFHMLAEAVGVAKAAAGESADAFIAWLSELKSALGIPAGLGAAGVHAGQIDRLVEVAFADGCHQTNPRPCSGEDFARIFRAAL